MLDSRNKIADREIYSNQRVGVDTVSYLQAIILGIVQGLTEFLPVSSSGHLVLFESLFRINEPTLAFEIFLHLGTLIAVFAAFWQEIVLLICSVIKMLRKPMQIPQLVKADGGCRLVVMLIVATIPIVIVGLWLQDWITQLFRDPKVTGLMLIVTGTLLYLSSRVSRGKKNLEQIRYADALFIGSGQALAVLPGLSRSGTTIAAGLLRGIERENAARFSFLLSIPAVLGSQVLAIKDVLTLPTGSVSIGVMATGTVAAAITGYLAIKLLINFVRRGKLTIFAYYTWCIGLLVVLFNM